MRAKAEASHDVITNMVSLCQLHLYSIWVPLTPMCLYILHPDRL